MGDTFQDDAPGRQPADTVADELDRAPCELTLLGDDTYADMQPINTAIIDVFIMAQENAMYCLRL